MGLSPTKLLALFNLVEIYPHQELIIMWTPTIIFKIVIIAALLGWHIFGGAHIWREICITKSARLILEGKFAPQTNSASL